MSDLLAKLTPVEQFDTGAVLLRGFCAHEADKLVLDIEAIARRAPFRIMSVPHGGTMSVAMTNCGPTGWITDARGYRYSASDPATDRPWPEMPHRFIDLARRAADAAGYASFAPDACLINCYKVGARMGLHQDKDERDFDQPIVSVSLGLSATFIWGGLARADKTRRIELANGDVAVWGGPTRRAYHGIAPIKGGTDPLTGSVRYNLTFRKAL